VSCLPFADCHCSARDCRRPPTSSARFVVDRSACTRSGTAPRRRQPNISGGRPRISGDRAGNQDRQFIGALLERFRHFGDLFLHLVAWHGRKIKPKPGHAIVRANKDARHRRLWAIVASCIVLAWRSPLYDLQFLATAPPHRATGRGQPISDRHRTARDEVGFVECQEQTLRRRRSRVAPSGVRRDWAPASGRWYRRRPQAKRP
jgi:hypothetical protein